MEPSNILNIDSLDSSWCDKDHVILHAYFQLLKDCIEKENLINGHIDWGQDEKCINAKAELSQLCSWWQRRVTTEEMITFSGINQYEEDTAMLIRLVNIRWTLWT